MLELISRIGAEFGISIVVASHLLGEIERICDHLVAIDSGRLLRADSMTSFTQASQVLAVEVEEGAAELETELPPRRPDGRRRPRSGCCWSSSAADDTYDVVRDAVADLALPLCRLEQRRRQVEELFRDGRRPSEVRVTASARRPPASSMTSATAATRVPGWAGRRSSGR